MSGEENKKLDELKKEIRESVIELKGMFSGVRMTGLNQTEEGILKIVEVVCKGFTNHKDDIISLYRENLLMKKRFENLEIIIKQFQKTLDTFTDNK